MSDEKNRERKPSVEKALEWALSQNYQSVAATHARTLAHALKALIKQSGKPGREEMHNELYDIVTDSKRRSEASVHNNSATVTVQSEREQSGEVEQSGKSGKPDTERE